MIRAITGWSLTSGKKKIGGSLMFGIGPAEMVVIAIVALVFIGPQRLPEVARQISRFVVQAKRTSSEFRDVIHGVVKKAELELSIEEQKKVLQQALELPKVQKSVDDSPSRVGQSTGSPLRQEMPDKAPSQGIEGSLTSTIRRDRPEAPAVDWEAEQDIDLPPLQRIPSEAVQGKEGSGHVPVG